MHHVLNPPKIIIHLKTLLKETTDGTTLFYLVILTSSGKNMVFYFIFITMKTEFPPHIHFPNFYFLTKHTMQHPAQYGLSNKHAQLNAKEKYIVKKKKMLIDNSNVLGGHTFSFTNSHKILEFHVDF